MFEAMETIMESHSIIRKYAIIQNCLIELYIEYTNPHRQNISEEKLNFIPCKKRKNVIRYSIPKSPTYLGKITRGELNYGK